MAMKEKTVGSSGEDGCIDMFPVGMRVLAVDDDPICLKVLETLLRKCQYHVTTTNQAIKALKMLRENRSRYDLVISDVNMPDLDGFKLLELVGFELDLPVIMLSAHSDTSLVIKGITHGACDYLLKPVRFEELKNIWQHVVRKKKPDSKDQIESPDRDKVCSSDQKVDKKRKDHQSEDEDEDGEDNEDSDPSNPKKPRVVWSVDLHRKFVASVNQLGLEKAVPKKILDLMNVEGLTRENVASHLQKYRLYLRRLSGVATQQANLVDALGRNDPSYLHMGSLDGFGDFRTLTGLGSLSSGSLYSYQPGGMCGRLNSVVLPANQKNQNGTLLTGIPTSIELNRLSRTMSANHFGEYNHVNDRNVFSVSTSFPLSTASGNPLLLQANTQRLQRSCAFGNQPSLCLTSLNQESIGMSVRGSSNWQDAVPLSNFPSSEAFGNGQFPSNNLLESIPWTNSIASSARLEDSRADMLCEAGLNNTVIPDIDVTAREQWEDCKQEYDGNLHNASSSKTIDVSLFGQLSGDAPFVVHHPDGTSLDTELRSDDDFLFEQSKPHNEFSQNSFETLEDIMSSMIKLEQNNEDCIHGWGVWM